MNWSIFEDSLENRKGHWFEYLDAFARELPRLGDKLSFFVSEAADAETLGHFGAAPLLPRSVFARMSDGASALVRSIRIPWHAWITFWRVSRLIKYREPADIVFVPTVTVHHLLAWYFLIHFTKMTEFPNRVLLFFVGFPSVHTSRGVERDGSPTGLLMSLLLAGLQNEILTGRVILGVETPAAKTAGEKLFGVPFNYLPHPVCAPQREALPAQELVFGCYGAARHEKGSDLLVRAITKYLDRYPESRARFVFQWVEDFTLPDGQSVSIPEKLLNHQRVKIVRRYFNEGEYGDYLERTSVMLLPYRSSAYRLRGSRVLVEAMLYGIPSVVSSQTTLAQQLIDYGAGVVCEEGDVESLVAAMRRAEADFQELKAKAMSRRQHAREHYSVEHFRQMLQKL